MGKVYYFSHKFVISNKHNMKFLTLDTAARWNDSKGHKCYGNQSDGQVTYDTVEKCFSTDVKAVGFLKVGEIVSVKMPANGIEIKEERIVNFRINKVDMDGSGEDTYGWHGSSINTQTPCKIFITND